MNIRDYDARDAHALARLYRRSVEQVGARDYSPPQVAAWASLAPTPAALQAMAADGRTRLVAVDDGDRPLAFADLAPDGHIPLFYCAPEMVGTGVAAVLYDALERRARAGGTERLHAEASEAVRRFFLKNGFIVTARRDFAVAGVPIHNYAVEKSLAGSGVRGERGRDFIRL